MTDKVDIAIYMVELEGFWAVDLVRVEFLKKEKVDDDSWNIQKAKVNKLQSNYLAYNKFGVEFIINRLESTWFLHDK